ncbi:Mobile element protein [hydrothermal vent metagenome]|uniref:Mobile element protein n=1 Tax=hydrothermal vent metagenome TaxID=652676 RepID=A0A3B0YB51_9ZZZZ
MGRSLSPALGKAFHKKKKRAGSRWRLDETYIKVKGQWRYYYRAVDKKNSVLDFLLTAKFDKKATLHFLCKAIGRNRQPSLINIDKTGANKAGIKSYNNETHRRLNISQCKYLNSIIEQDHRFIKRKTKLMLGFNSFTVAQKHWLVLSLFVCLRKDKCKKMRDEVLSPADQFYALAP